MPERDNHHSPGRNNKHTNGHGHERHSDNGHKHAHDNRPSGRGHTEFSGQFNRHPGHGIDSIRIDVEASRHGCRPSARIDRVEIEARGGRGRGGHVAVYGERGHCHSHAGHGGFVVEAAVAAPMVEPVFVAPPVVVEPAPYVGGYVHAGGCHGSSFAMAVNVGTPPPVVVVERPAPVVIVEQPLSIYPYSPYPRVMAEPPSSFGLSVAHVNGRHGAPDYTSVRVEANDGYGSGFGFALDALSGGKRRRR